MTDPVRYAAVPQIEAGTHEGPIAQLLATADGRRLISAGDTTIRVWDLAAQRCERLLLGQVDRIADERAVDGRVDRIAASPDGRWVVALRRWRQRVLAALDPRPPRDPGHDGGWVTEVQVYALDTGNLHARHVHPGLLLDLDFSPDGRWLATAGLLRDGRVRQAEVRLLAVRDLLRPGDRAPPPPKARLAVGPRRRSATLQAAVRFVAPLPHARGGPQLVAAISDESSPQGHVAWLGHRERRGLELQRLEACGEPLAPLTLSAGPSMAAVAALASRGRKLRGRLLWFRHDGSARGGVDTEAPPASTAFSPSGHRLMAGLIVDPEGTLAAPTGMQTVQVNAYEVAATGAPALRSTYYGHDGSVWALTALGDDRAASSGGDHQAIHCWRHDRRVAELQLALRGVGRVAYEPGITADERVLFGTVPVRLLPPGHPKRQQSFDLRRLQLTTTAASDIRCNDFVSRKWWVSYDDSPVISLRYRGDTDERTPDREPELKLFVGADDEWVIWCRSGYYASSPGARGRIGYRVSRGPAQEALLVPSDRFIAFYRPDLVKAVVRHGTEARARARGVAIPPMDVVHMLPPIVELAPDGVRQADGRVGFELTLESPCPAHLPTRVSVLRNGRVVWIDRTPPQRPHARCSVPALPLLPGANRFAIHAENALAKSVPLELQLTGPELGNAAADVDAPGRLYLLSVGVAEFTDPATPRLRFPPRDAQAVYDAFVHGRLEGPRGAQQPAGNRAFESVVASVLVNAQATKAAILAELDRMCSEIHQRHREAGAERDVLFVFLSGHGTQKIDGTSVELYFQNFDMKPTWHDVAETGLSMLDLGDRVTSVPAEVVLVIDACHAALAGTGVVAGLDAEELARRVQSIHERGMYLVSAARATEFAREDSGTRLGVLTASLLEALHEARTGARGVRDGGLQVLMSELMAGVQRLVPVITARAGTKPQTPVCRIYGDLVPLTILKT